MNFIIDLIGGELILTCPICFCCLELDKKEDLFIHPITGDAGFLGKPKAINCVNAGHKYRRPTFFLMEEKQS